MTNKLGNTIKNLRVTQGLTQQDLAARVPCDRSYIAQLELGTKTNASLDILKKIAAVFAVPLSHLLA